MGGFKPNLVSYFPGRKSLSGAGSHEFSGRFISSKSLFSSRIQRGELIFESRKESLSQNRVGMGFISIEKREQRCLGGVMESRVVMKFG